MPAHRRPPTFDSIACLIGGIQSMETKLDRAHSAPRTIDGAKWTQDDADAVAILTRLGAECLADLHASKPASTAESIAWAGVNMTTRAVFYLLNPFLHGKSKPNAMPLPTSNCVEGTTLALKVRAVGADRYGKGEVWR